METMAWIPKDELQITLAGIGMSISATAPPAETAEDGYNG